MNEGSGPDSAGGAATGSDAAPFDFRAMGGLPEATTRPLLHDLSIAVPTAGLVLSSMTRRAASGLVGAPRAMDASVVPASTVWFAIPGPNGQVSAVLLIDRPVVVGLADLFMGGPATKTDRDPTELERTICARRLREVFEPIGHALAQHPALELDEIRLVPISRDELGLEDRLARWPVQFRVDEEPYDITFCFPTKAFAPAQTEAAAPETVEAPAMVAALANVAVSLAVRFQPTELPAIELDNLAIGDVIRLEHPVHEPLVGEVEGRPLLLAAPGRSRHNLAVEVLELVEREPSR